jgi:hypothetical protein
VHASFTYWPSSPAPGETVHFTDTSTAEGHAIDFQNWDLDGDGVFESKGPSVDATYPAAGSYNVTLVVFESDFGEFDVARQVVVVAPHSTTDGSSPPAGGDTQFSGFPSLLPPVSSLGGRLDRRAPLLTARIVGAAGIRALLKKRFGLRLHCDEACLLTIRIVVSKKLTKRFKIARGGVLSRGSGFLRRPGSTTLDLGPTGQRVRRALRHRRSVVVDILVDATDAAGNVRHVFLHLTLHR